MDMGWDDLLAEVAALVDFARRRREAVEAENRK